MNEEIETTLTDLKNFKDISGLTRKVEKSLKELLVALEQLPEGHHAYEIADEITEAAEQIIEMSARMMAGWWFSVNGYEDSEEEE